MLKKRIKIRLLGQKQADLFLFFTLWKVKPKVINQTTGKKKSKNWSIVLFLVNILVLGIVLWTQLKSEGGIHPLKELFETNLYTHFLIAALLCFVLVVLVETVRTNFLIKNLQHKNHFSLAYKSYALSRYYDLIIPFSIAGQPYMIFYLKNRKIPTSNAMSIVSAKFISQLLSILILSFVVMLFSGKNSILLANSMTADVVVAQTMAWIGFSINVLIVLGIILFSVNKKIMDKIIRGFVWILKKLRISKKPQLLYIKIVRTLLSYQRSMKNFFAKKSVAFTTLTLNILSWLLHYSLPFLIFCVFNGFQFSQWFAILSIGVMIDLGAGLMPLPGGSGMAELSFIALFGSLFLEGTAFWALLLWRIFTYYSYIIQGAFVMIYDYAFGNRKLKNKITHK